MPSANGWGRCSCIDCSHQLDETTSAFARSSIRELCPASFGRGAKFSYTVRAAWSIWQVEAWQAFVGWVSRHVPVMMQCIVGIGNGMAVRGRARTRPIPPRGSLRTDGAHGGDRREGYFS